MQGWYSLLKFSDLFRYKRTTLYLGFIMWFLLFSPSTEGQTGYINSIGKEMPTTAAPAEAPQTAVSRPQLGPVSRAKGV